MAARGFTLVELLASLAVASILLSLALPSFQRLIASHRGAAAMNQMAGAVSFARGLSITTGQVVTLCPGRDGGCLGRDQWHLGALIFVDHNGNGSLDGDERVERVLSPLAPGERIYWRSFRNRSYLQFHARGYTRWQNGNLLYCPPDGDRHLARMAIINPPGRLRIARDTDGDGIVEDAAGRPIACP